jgi:hypothetical protein
MAQNSLVYQYGETDASVPAPVAHPTVDSRSHRPGLLTLPSSTARRRRLLWGVCGTVLSAVGFILFALFEQYNGMVAELRTDLKHFNETSSEFVKRDSLQKMREHMKEYIKDVQALNVTRAQVEQELKASEKARVEMAAELQRMRERLAFLEGRQAATPATSAAPLAKE